MTYRIFVGIIAFYFSLSSEVFSSPEPTEQTWLEEYEMIQEIEDVHMSTEQQEEAPTYAETEEAPEDPDEETPD